MAKKVVYKFYITPIGTEVVLPRVRVAFLALGRPTRSNPNLVLDTTLACQLAVPVHAWIGLQQK